MKDEGEGDRGNWQEGWLATRLVREGRRKEEEIADQHVEDVVDGAKAATMSVVIGRGEEEGRGERKREANHAFSSSDPQVTRYRSAISHFLLTLSSYTTSKCVAIVGLTS